MQRSVIAVLFAMASSLASCAEPGLPLGPPDAGAPDDGTPDDGTPDDGTPEADAAIEDSGAGSADMGASGDMGAVDADATSDLGVGGCPLVAGSYALGSTGPGCGALAATQSVTQSTPGSCTVQFDTTAALSGSVEVASDGSFTGQTLAVGGSSRSCRGTWNAPLTQFSIVCGAGPSICNVTLD